jgi:hypothetical protein
MNRLILACGIFVLTTATLVAQQASQSSPYQGTSSPPPDDSIITTTDTPAKPPAGHPLVQQADQQSPVPSQQTTPAPQQYAPQTVAPGASMNYAPQANGDGTDEGIVGVAPSSAPPLVPRYSTPDPDGDIVHPGPLPPGTLGEGAMIRVRLLDGLSSALSERGEPFRGRVATDVLQDGQVLIPAGSEIDGQVAEVSSGHFGGHGSILLRPESVTLSDGTSYKLHAVVQSAPGSGTRVGAEGTIAPGSRVKRDGIEYGGVVGGGVITGAILGGPAGALAGGIVGAGVVTVHLLVSHPQAKLESGTVLILTLTEPMRLVPNIGVQGN